MVKYISYNIQLYFTIYKSFSSSLLYPFAESNLPSMVVQSTDKRILEFKKTCSLFNNGKDGCIPTNAELQVIKNEVDAGGTIYVAHLLDWIREIFIKFDEDHNHFISVDEFRHFATNLDKHEMNVETADGAVYAYDHNGDGQLNLDEFTHIVIVMIKDKDKF
jgi:Ca2+-binding EF-hand superfamily protein